MLYEVHFITPNGKEMTSKFVIPKHVNVLKHIKASLKDMFKANCKIIKITKYESKNWSNL
mgnify:FL=1